MVGNKNHYNLQVNLKMSLSVLALKRSFLKQIFGKNIGLLDTYYNKIYRKEMFITIIIHFEYLMLICKLFSYITLFISLLYIICENKRINYKKKLHI